MKETPIYLSAATQPIDFGGYRNGDAGGEPGEFEDHMRQALVDWFDGADVKLRTK